MGLALSTFVHRSDQAMIQKKLSDFAAKGKIRPSIVSFLNYSTYRQHVLLFICIVFYVYYICYCFSFVNCSGNIYVPERTHLKALLVLFDYHSIFTINSSVDNVIDLFKRKFNVSFFLFRLSTVCFHVVLSHLSFLLLSLTWICLSIDPAGFLPLFVLQFFLSLFVAISFPSLLFYSLLILQV